MPNNPAPDSPTEKSLAPNPGGQAGRLQRSPRRRHTKSQNGCPKEARTAQLVRVGEQDSAGKGEGDSRKSRRQNRRQDYRPPSCTATTKCEYDTVKGVRETAPMLLMKEALAIGSNYSHPLT
ncbi:AP-4 complex subunit sigma-1 isoform X3 [Lutra lutra]|uniref:AP-4 complex subunit sigma-1 isoform X3 n=1 Tax=Lutra lutra TaxID=9657 RepID=UPI001FD1864E|nr:AP-4 complex subunit sigma-1 isoform X3 [Lutra lutra]